jgi:Zn-dependent M28 family amino/carboxypeptidase
VYVGKGAIDNGSGTTAVMELAHQLADAKVERTIRFLTYGGEEDGLFGSFAYVEAHSEEISQNAVACLNFDMPHVNLQRDNRGWITPDNDDRFGVFEAILADINAERPDLDERFDYSISLMEHPGEVGTDSMPFAQAGVETVNFWGSGSWEYHTYLEDMTRFVPDGLEMAVMVGGSYAMWMADQG